MIYRPLEGEEIERGWEIRTQSRSKKKTKWSSRQHFPRLSSINGPVFPRKKERKKKGERESLISSPVRTSRNNYSGWLFAHSSLLRPMVYISDEVRICHKYTERSSISLSPWSTPRAHAVGDTYGCLPPPPPPPILPELLLLLLLGPIPRRGRKPRSRIARNPSSCIVFGAAPFKRVREFRAVWHLTPEEEN